MKLADVRLINRSGAVVATVSGEIDMSNATELQEALSRATPNETGGLVLDLTSLDYLDSAGIQLLFRLYGDLVTRGQRLVLVIPDGSVVAGTFRLAGVTGRMEVAADVDQALAALTPEAAAS
jgi:anti-anti-sigma factor